MVIEVKIVRDEIDINDVVKSMTEASKEEGSLVLFLGFVKSVVNGNNVKRLIYEAYEPYATESMLRIVKEVIDSDVTQVRVYHRIGSLKPHEPTIYIFVVAKNRSKAFDVAKEILERIKHEVPIFKLEVRDDGEYWVLGNGKRVRRERADK